MSKRDLYKAIGGRPRPVKIIRYMNLISYADGLTPLSKIAIINKISYQKCLENYLFLEKKSLITFEYK